MLDLLPTTVLSLWTVINFAFINLYFQDMRNLRFAHKVENHSRRLVYDKLMVFKDSSNLSLYI